MVRRLAVSLLVVLCPLTAARAEDEAAAPQRVIERFDLSAYRGLPVVDGPLLLAPCDRTQEQDVPTQWSVSEWAEPGSRRAPWVAFDQGDSDQALSMDALIQLLGGLAPQETSTLGLDAQAGHVLSVQGTREELEALRVRLAWALGALAPHADLAATLVGGEEGGLVAAGRARLYAGRWTRVWFQEQRPLYPVDWAIEIAQESTAMHPTLQALSEGQELYVRWLPGEVRSVVELWSGDLEHLDDVQVDLTSIRNVPESSGPGPARLPRTALRRTYTALLLEPGGAATLDWRGPEGVRHLRLELRSALPPSEPYQRDDFRVGILRSGALAAGLLFDVRQARTDSLNEELYAVPPPNTEISVDTLSDTGGSLTVVRAVAPAFEAVRAHLRQREASLAAATLRLRTVTVPEESLRPLLASGAIAVGEPLSGPSLATLKSAGLVAGHGLDFPLLVGAKAGFRVGQSVPGLVRLDVEVAQQSAGMDPSFGVRFAGLAGEAVLASTPQGLVLRLDATLSWADPKGGSVDLTFRPPVGMAFSKDRPQNELEGFRRVTLPTLAGSAAEVVATLPLAAGDAAERLAGMTVRGGEAVLLLVAVEVK